MTKRAKKILICERCGKDAGRATHPSGRPSYHGGRHTCITCKRLCCYDCCPRHGEWYEGQETWWECRDGGNCIGRDRPPSEYAPAREPPPFEEVLADIECITGEKSTPAQIQGYKQRWAERNALALAKAAQHNALVAENLERQAAALAPKAECLLCDELDSDHPTRDGHDVCRKLDMGRT